MKALLLLLSFLPLFATAQTIPNGNFENWNFADWFYDPVDWATTNEGVSVSVIRDTDSYQGDFAMQVVAVPNGLGSYGEATTDFEINFIPEALNFYTKYYCESGGVAVEIFFYNDSILVSSSGWYNGDTLDTYSLISIPLEPIDPIVTHAIVKVSASVGDFAAGNARILVDQMGFGESTSVNEIEASSILVYPNPANSTVTIQAQKRIGQLNLYDAAGKTVLSRYISDNSTEIDVSAFSAGVYTLFSESGTQKLVVK